MSSSLLGALPPLHGRRAAAESAHTASPLAPPPTSTPPPFHHPSSHNLPPHPRTRNIQPLRFALRVSPPLLALEYFHSSPASSRRCTRARLFHINTDGHTAQQLASQLQQSYPDYLAADLVSLSQLVSLMTRLLSPRQPSPSPPSSASSSPSPSSSSLLKLDLNRVAPEVLEAAKAEMGKSFHTHLVRPGDPQYVYDKRVEYDDPCEPSDWD